MLKTAAIGTVGIVGAVLVESEGVASAAPGRGTFASSTSAPAVEATNTGKGNAMAAKSGLGTTIHGSQTSADSSAVAVRGTIDSKTPGAGTGVVGSAPHGTGVSGGSVSGNGVHGSSTSGIGIIGTSASTSADAAAVQGTITSTSPGPLSAGVLGINNGTGGNGVGVFGSQNGFGYGVYGYTPSGYGVVGQSGDGIGVHGIATAGGYGVMGDTSDGNGYGVYGNADNGTGVYGNADNGTGVTGATASGTGVEGSATTGTGVHGVSTGGYGVYGFSSGSYGTVGVTNSGNGVYGQVSTASQAGVVGRQEDSSGNWAIYGFGNIGATGTKSAVVPTEDGSGYVTLYCVESPECWFEDFGSARLSGGTSSVLIDPEFAQTIETDHYHVFLQVEGECKGVSVQAKTPTGFAVRELDGGTSNAPFAYRVVGLRKDVTAPRLNRVTLPIAHTEVV
jgi:hypothetical protein